MKRFFVMLTSKYGQCAFYFSLQSKFANTKKKFLDTIKEKKRISSSPKDSKESRVQIQVSLRFKFRQHLGCYLSMDLFFSILHVHKQTIVPLQCVNGYDPQITGPNNSAD